MAGNIAAGFTTGSNIYQPLDPKAIEAISSNSLLIAEEIIKQIDQKYPDESRE